MVGHLAAPIDLQHRDIAGRNQMLAPAIHAEREYRWVFDEPDFIAGLLVALIGESLHVAPNRFVGLQPEATDQGRVTCARHQSDRRLSMPALLRASACSAR